MRRRTSVAPKQGLSIASSTAPLAESIARERFKTEVLDGKTFLIPLDNKQKRQWKTMSDNEIVAYAKAYIAEKGMKKISELQKGPNKDTGLCSELQNRTLISQAFQKKQFEEVLLDNKTFRVPLDNRGLRNWAKMSDNEIVAYAKAYIAEKEIKKISELARGSNKNFGLKNIIEKRKLVDKLFRRGIFEEVTLEGKIFKIPLNAEGNRNWSKVSNFELVSYARAYCKEKGIIRPNELQEGPNKDKGLYHQLQRRKLIDQVFERKQFDEVTLDGKKFKIPLDNHENRNWVKTTNNEIVSYARAYCKEKGITRQFELRKGANKDSGLCQQLQRRKLMDNVFLEIKAAREVSALAGLASALESFGGKNE